MNPFNRRKTDEKPKKDRETNKTTVDAAKPTKEPKSSPAEDPESVTHADADQGKVVPKNTRTTRNERLKLAEGFKSATSQTGIGKVKKKPVSPSRGVENAPGKHRETADDVSPQLDSRTKEAKEETEAKDAKQFGPTAAKSDDSQNPHHDGDSKAEHLTRWQKYVEIQDSISSQRIEADEIRRKYRLKREEVMKNLKQLPLPVAVTEPLLELEELETQLDKVDGKLIQSEGVSASMTQRVLGDKADITDYFLENNGVYLSMIASTSMDESTDRDDVGKEDESSDEYRRLLEKHEEIDLLHEELLEMDDDKQKLRSRNAEDLGTKGKDFLMTYDSKNAEVREKLRRAMDELEVLRDALQTSASEPRDSLESRDSVADPGQLDSSAVVNWLSNQAT